MSNADQTRERKLTGWHALVLFVGGFGIIIAVNVYMAYQAIHTFPGLEVSSGYADSQDFNERRAGQEALGWQTAVEIDADAGVLTLHLTDADGNLVVPGQLTALLTRPTDQLEDQLLDLTVSGTAYTAPVSVGPGRWRLRGMKTSLSSRKYVRSKAPGTHQRTR